MGKKVKKLGKKVGKLGKKLARMDPITRKVEDTLAGFGLPTFSGVDQKALAAKRALQAQMQQSDQQHTAQLQSQRDSAADLSIENVADVRVGAAADASQDRLRRKRKPGTSLASQLGIGV